MLFSKAYARAASVGTASSGFKKSGIWPFNKDIFQDYEFITLAEDDDPQNDSENMDVDPLSLTSGTSSTVTAPQPAGPSVQPCISSIDIQNEPVVHTGIESQSQRTLELASSHISVDSAVHTDYELNEQVPRTVVDVSQTHESPSAKRGVQTLRQVRRRHPQQTATSSSRISPNHLDMSSSSEHQNNDVRRSFVPSDSAMTNIVPTSQLEEPGPSKAATPTTSSDFHIASISPGARKVIVELRSRSRKPQRALELTSSPYKRDLETAKTKKNKTKSQPQPKKVNC